MIFSHSGAIGDIIYHLPIMRRLGGGDLYILPQGRDGYRTWEDMQFTAVQPLAEAQPYITKCDWFNGRAGLCFDDWRNHLDFSRNLTDQAARWLGIPDLDPHEPWLTVDAPKSIAPVIFGRSQRANHTQFPWREAVEKYAGNAIFLGLPHEHDEFVRHFGHVPFHPTKDLLEAARVIAGGQLYIGNGSSLLAVAEGLKVDCVVAAVPEVDHCLRYRRPGQQHCHHTAIFPDLKDFQPTPPPAPTPRPRIAIVSGWDASCDDVAAVTWPNKEEYCRLHRYDAVKLTGPVPRNGYWTKMYAGMTALPKYDWIFLMDVDTLIMDMSVKLESFLPVDGPEEFVGTVDAHGINMGQSFWKNSEWAVRFMNKVYDGPGQYQYFPVEQAVLAHLMYAEPKEKWKILPQRSFNSYCYGHYPGLFPYGYPIGEYRPGDFLIHCPGMSNPARIAFFKENMYKVTRPGISRLGTPRNHTAIDAPHANLLCGVIMSSKPARVLELGVGTGYATKAITDALLYNKHGALTCVDNWIDYGGEEPPLAGELRSLGAIVVTASEGEFVAACRDTMAGAYDVIVSDADHHNAQNFVDDHLRLLAPGGFLFYHDTINGDYPNLATIREKLTAAGVKFTEFSKNTRPDERCQRGWLMATKETTLQ